MEFLVLGPLEVRSENGVVALGGVKPRAVLAVLLLHANEPVSAERLALALWGEEASSSAVKTVQVHVSRLRRALGDADRVATTAAGYRLRVLPGELDAEQFELLVEEGRRALAAGQAKQAAAVLREALSLWRGPALEDVAYEPFAQAEITRLEEQRLAALEARVEADLGAGCHHEVIGELQRLLTIHPTRERLFGQLMLALYRCGRQAEALQAYRDARRVLVDEAGVEPGPDLNRLQEAILHQDASLELRQVVAELPRELDLSTAAPLVGRDGELAWLCECWERARAGVGALITMIGPRGSGKTRVAAELAREARRFGATVLYAAGTGRAEGVSGAIARAREATLPTLVVLDDADHAGADVLAKLGELARVLAAVPVLVLACGEDDEALASLATDGSLTLGLLGAEAVRAITAAYAPGRADEDVPVEWLLDSSGGIAGRVHEVAGQWARREAARRVDVGAGRTAAGRDALRSMEAELTGDVVELQAARARVASHGHDAPMVCPFKGLASFDIADAEYFFGRETLIAELVARLVGAHLLGIVGPSGSGKSSVTRAGLLPALASGVLPGSETWEQVLLRPGEHPLRELTDALGALGDGERVVVAVDQFEETFTTCEDEAERAAFIAQLGRMAGQRDGRYVVVIALRADFYGRCAAYPELAVLLAANHVLVGSMQRVELRRAIELPAHRVGLSVDPELADALVDDVKDEPGGLPLLSTALLELWQRRDGRRMRYTVYDQTGGVRGAVARLAEDAFGQLDVGQQRLARGVLMRLAGQGAAGGVERRRVPLEELETDRNEDVARVVALLTDRRLLTVSSGTIELAHEALLREWPRLSGWIDADREGLRIHRNLNAAACAWEDLGRDDGALYRGARLTEATEWNKARQPRLNKTERAYLAASEAARQRDRKGRRRRVALAFGSLIMALLAISIVAVVSISQSRTAQRQRDIAASRELAGRASSLLDSDPGLSRIIALAAYKRHDTTQAESAVRQATLADRATAILPADKGPVSMVSPSPDGRLVATAGDDGSVGIWNLQRRSLSSTIRRHRAPATAAGFNPDGTKIATAGKDGVVALADVDGRNRHVLLTIKPGSADHPTYPNSVEFSSDASRLVVGAQDGTVRIIKLKDRTSRVLGHHQAPVRRARFNKAATKVVSAGYDGLTRIWDLTRDTSPLIIRGNEAVYDASFSPDGRHVATASVDGYLRIWDAGSGRRVTEPVKVVAQDLLSVRFSRDGSQLVTGAGDGVVRVYDAQQALLLAELKGSVGYVNDAAFVAGGAIVSCGEEGALRVWAPVETRALRGEATPSPSFSADRQHVVWGDDVGYVHRWDIATGSDRRLSERAAGVAILVQESIDGSRLVAVPDGLALPAAIRLYAAKSGRLLRSVPSDMATIFAVAIDRSGRRIAVAGKGPRIRIHEYDGGGRVLHGHTGDVYGLAFSPNGKHLVTASTDGTARIFNADTGESERTLHGHANTVTSVAYSADGEQIVTAGADSTIRIWPAKGGAATVLYGHRGAVNSAVFNSSGDQVVSAGEDGTVRVWDAVSGQSLVILQQYEVASGADVSSNGRLVVSHGGVGIPNRGLLKVTPCEVCGPFSDVLRLARSRANRKLSATSRKRLLGEGS
ncbi:MAG TPA: BTAD domain-containing putative transcriptional regulator [Solirubrobacteraceae bacterium]|jgi:WD40 repeat protein/DNA-binding SARP family transcriptional activator|nr:BTAD domain-containing putative transcriptional regulator [Solirubrobacteraceae bacterium]